MLNHSTRHALFVSYPVSSGHWIDDFVNWLESHLVKCWMAPRDLRGGPDGERQIEDAILASRIFALCVTDDTFDAPGVTRELRIAQALKKPIFAFVDGNANKKRLRSLATRFNMPRRYRERFHEYSPGFQQFALSREERSRSSPPLAFSRYDPSQSSTRLEDLNRFFHQLQFYMPRRTFISYRRRDCEAAAEALHTRLETIFGEHSVHFDKRSFPIFRNFERHIAYSLYNSWAVLALIGPQWRRRSPFRFAMGALQGDYVYTEIALALEYGVPILPILLGDCEMPTSARLPKRLHKLCEINAVRIEDNNWENVVAEVDRLKFPHFPRH